MTLRIARALLAICAALALPTCGGGSSGTNDGGSGNPQGDSSNPTTDATSSDSGSSSGGDSTATPSCAPGGPGMSNCGPGGNGTESCCTSLAVMGGTFYRGYSTFGGADGGLVRALDGGPTGLAYPATVSTFRLDKYLVTVGRFRQFVAAWKGGAGYTPAAGSGKHLHLNGGQGLVDTSPDAGTTYEPGWIASDDSNVAPTSANLDCPKNNNSSTWTASTSGQENLPMNCANWWEAYAFCIWDGGFLPSAVELEYAQAGGDQQRVFPWGSTDPGTDNQYAIYGCHYPTGADACAFSLVNVAPVGTPSLGAGRYGQLELTGEVTEWTADWFGNPAIPCIDCANVTAIATSAGSFKVTKGGYRFQPVQSLIPTNNAGYDPTYRIDTMGFRCARTP